MRRTSPPLSDAARLTAAAKLLRRAEAATRKAERLLTAEYDLPWTGAVRDAGAEVGRCAEGCERYGRQG